mmetsp:Transcript_92127/g.137935  ORF Transcript_92127/g.137935 Transcript_92127/m.137935 type:complete len:88 (-) Transcript_92127:215-478(-)
MSDDIAKTIEDVENPEYWCKEPPKLAEDDENQDAKADVEKSSDPVDLKQGHVTLDLLADRQASAAERQLQDPDQDRNQNANKPREKH